MISGDIVTDQPTLLRLFLRRVLQQLLGFKHLLLILNAIVIHLFHQRRQETLLVFPELYAIRCHCVRTFNDRVTFNQRLNDGKERFLLDNHFRADVVLHDEVRIKAVQVEGNDPLAHTDLWFLDVTTDQIIVVRCLFELVDNDVTIKKIVVNDNVPWANGCHRIAVVNFGIIREGNHLLDELELLLEHIDQRNVVYVIVIELLGILNVQLIQRTVLGIVELLRPKLLLGNVIEPIALLHLKLELSIKIQVVKNVDTSWSVGLILSPTNLNLTFLEDTPRRKFLGFVLTQDNVYSVNQIGNVEELDVPAGHDIRKVATRLPDLQKVAKKVPLILTLDVVNAIGWCVILHAKQHLLTLTTEGDSGYFLVCLFNVGESV